MQNKSTIRKFIRHPSDIPIQVILVESPDELENDCYETLHNVSLGGLAFLSNCALSVGQYVNVYFPIIDQTHCFTGKVVWVNLFAKGFDTGIEFENADELYSLRMVQQVCHIEGRVQ